MMSAAMKVPIGSIRTRCCRFNPSTISRGRSMSSKSDRSVKPISCLHNTVRSRFEWFSSNALKIQEDLREETEKLGEEPVVIVNAKLDNETLAIDTVISNLQKALHFNQGKGGTPNGPYSFSKKCWDVDFVRETIDGYEMYLRYFYDQKVNQYTTSTNSESSYNKIRLNVDPIISDRMKEFFLSPETTEQAFISLLRCRLPTHVLSRKIREWEKYIGTICLTDMTDSLSLHMLEANGKAGNVGRAIKLLTLRKSRGYSPRPVEFVFAIKAIDAAGLTLRKNRNVFLAERDQPQIDDPTRWLDAILLNMHQRDFSLTTRIANRMLHTYTTTGRSAKSNHFFYRITRHPLDNNGENMDEQIDDSSGQSNDIRNMATLWNRPVKIKMQMRPPPPYHKIPSQVRGKLIRKPGSDVKQLKLDRESDPDWSPVLTSAISFADSLKHGACGHDPVELDLISYSILMDACVKRGSLWRAMHIFDEVMPDNGIEPDIISYNILLLGLSRVADVPTMQEYFRQLVANGLSPTKETIEAVVDGLLNLGDVVSAITFCQDSFNQHSMLPPYTTHIKILEFSLARGLVYEAKRHVYFIQQLWKWTPNQYHSDEFCRLMEVTQQNPQLSKEALQKIFAYFGEKLEDSDFF